MRRIWVIPLLLFTVTVVQAQTGGQFCLRAYEDRNGSGALDSGEPFLTRGVSANLLNADNLVIASALMDDSPNAAQGVICFQFLEAGQYSLQVTSVDYEPTTPDTFTASISESALPTVVEYGARRAALEMTPSASTVSATQPDQRDSLGRIVLSGLGALVVMASMAVFGALVYLVAFRQRRPALQVPPIAAPTDYTKTPTGSMPPVEETDTSEIKPVQ
jgi:hypothetical protein